MSEQRVRVRVRVCVCRGRGTASHCVFPRLRNSPAVWRAPPRDLRKPWWVMPRTPVTETLQMKQAAAGGPGAHHPTALTWLGTKGPHGALWAPPPRTPCWLPLWPRVPATEPGSVPAGRCPVTWWKQPPEPRTKVRAIHEPFRPSSSQSPSPPRMCCDLSSSVASWLWRPA